MLFIGSSQSPKVGETVIEEHNCPNSDTYGSMASGKGLWAGFSKPQASSLALYVYRDFEN